MIVCMGQSIGVKPQLQGSSAHWGILVPAIKPLTLVSDCSVEIMCGLGEML